MAKGNAPAKLTGGQGFRYEDLVAARFLLGMLGAPHPLGSDLGQLTRIDWQAVDAGWRLDDLALTFGAGDQERCAGMSNKSHKQVTEGGFNDTFTRASARPLPAGIGLSGFTLSESWNSQATALPGGIETFRHSAMVTRSGSSSVTCFWRRSSSRITQDRSFPPLGRRWWRMRVSY